MDAITVTIDQRQMANLKWLDQIRATNDQLADVTAPAILFSIHVTPDTMEAANYFCMHRVLSKPNVIPEGFWRLGNQDGNEIELIPVDPQGREYPNVDEFIPAEADKVTSLSAEVLQIALQEQWERVGDFRVEYKPRRRGHWPAMVFLRYPTLEFVFNREYFQRAMAGVPGGEATFYEPIRAKGCDAELRPLIVKSDERMVILMPINPNNLTD
ncbi:MAG: hypothetical protein JW892_17510 [Anaerolineae bacterium]|nr:hypothetical protein [Anaerolineae bacterium]